MTNRVTGTFKTLLTLTVMLLATIFPIGNTQTIKITLWASIASFVIGIIIPNVMEHGGLRNRVTIEVPKWTDPIKEKRPLTYVQLIGFLLLAAGIGGLIGGLLNGQIINFIGTVLVAIGLGTLLSMYLTLATTKKN